MDSITWDTLDWAFLITMAGLALFFAWVAWLLAKERRHD